MLSLGGLLKVLLRLAIAIEGVGRFLFWKRVFMFTVRGKPWPFDCMSLLSDQLIEERRHENHGMKLYAEN